MSLEIKNMKTNRRRENSNIRKLGKTGRGASISLTLPIELVRELGWRDNQKVTAKKHGKGILIEDWKE